MWAWRLLSRLSRLLRMWAQTLYMRRYYYEKVLSEVSSHLEVWTTIHPLNTSCCFSQVFASWKKTSESLRDRQSAKIHCSTLIKRSCSTFLVYQNATWTLCSHYKNLEDWTIVKNTLKCFSSELFVNKCKAFLPVERFASTFTKPQHHVYAIIASFRTWFNITG